MPVDPFKEHFRNPYLRPLRPLQVQCRVVVVVVVVAGVVVVVVAVVVVVVVSVDVIEEK